MSMTVNARSLEIFCVLQNKLIGEKNSVMEAWLRMCTLHAIIIVVDMIYSELHHYDIFRIGLCQNMFSFIV